MKGAENHRKARGSYDGERLFDTSQLASFPDYPSLTLTNRVISRLEAIIAVPKDLPDDMIETPIAVMVGGKVEPDYVSCQPLQINVVVAR